MKENSIEEDIKIIEYNMKCIRNVMNNFEDKLCENMQIKTDEVSKIIYNILSDYKRVLKENEELTISNKEIDKECSRLEKKEIELINENEHYKDLIYALKTYYDITEEDLEKCMKNDR